MDDKYNGWNIWHLKIKKAEKKGRKVLTNENLKGFENGWKFQKWKIKLYIKMDEGFEQV
jgi:hypothetical protein